MTGPSALRRWRGPAALAATACFCACGGSSAEVRDASREPVGTAAALERTDTGLPFARAAMWKPATEPAPEGIDPYLAPLIYVEADGPESARLGPEQAPRVSFARTAWAHEGVELAQWTFAWETWRPAGPGAATGTLDPQALRVTYGSDGYPAIVEVLAGPKGTPALYVTEDLEALAAAEHGSPLDGRRFAVESEQVRVTGVIGTGAMPMGPFVYEPAAGPGVALVHCRCRPSQVEEVTESREFVLVEDASVCDMLDAPEAALSGLRLPVRF